MTITQLMGGLGNQMFQYAAGRALSLRTSEPLSLDITGLARDPLRSYALGDFNIEAGLINSRRKRPPKFKVGTQQAVANRIFGLLGLPRRIVEPSLRFDPAILQHCSNAYLSGFWQCERYFADHAETIRSELSLRAPLTGERVAIAQQVAMSNAISVHIRCGDDPNDPAARAIFGICDTEWFREAMWRMEDRIENPTFFVFSDHPPFAREIIKSQSSLVFIDPDADGRDCEDLMLMSLCKAHIIPNSTFSWWGAWLNGRLDKHVIAPARWYADETMTFNDIVPEHWERL